MRTKGCTPSFLFFALIGIGLAPRSLLRRLRREWFLLFYRVEDFLAADLQRLWLENACIHGIVRSDVWSTSFTSLPFSQGYARYRADGQQILC